MNELKGEFWVNIYGHGVGAVTSLTQVAAVEAAKNSSGGPGNPARLAKPLGQLQVTYGIEETGVGWGVGSWHPTVVADTFQRSKENQRSHHEGPTVQAEKPQRSPIEEQAAMRRQVYAELLRPLVHMLDGFSPTSEAVLNPVEVFLVRRVLADYLGEAT